MSRKSTRRPAARKARGFFTRRRRGMVLLVVLSLLAIFTLITVSFVLVASQGRRTAVAAARADNRGNDPRSLLHEAMLQLVRGTDNPLSVLQNHSLLEDMYGNDAVTGMVTALPTAVTSSGVVQQAVVQFDTHLLTGPDPFGMASRFSRSGNFGGCVVTMTSGPLTGKSTRIVDYEPDLTTNPPGAIGQLQIKSFGGNTVPQPGDRFVINGKAFNGVGFGMENFPSTPGAGVTVPAGTNPSLSGFPAPLLDYSDAEMISNYPGSTWPRALLPNPVFAARDPSYTSGTPDETLTLSYDPAGPGGADESYDAADYQNPHLAMHYWDSTTNSVITRLPSFHRPDLINWWSNRITTLLGQPYNFASKDAATIIGDLQADFNDTRKLTTVVRKAMMRPNPVDHPAFPGNDPNLGTPFHPLWGYGTQLNPEWDVDNDGDAKRDSVWVDLGLPAQPTGDGRWFKPMFAVLCVDMDGRLNLNAHGNPNHLDLAAYQPATGSSMLYGPIPAATPGTLTVNDFSFGQGYGPAEVNLRRVLVDPTNTVDPYRHLLEGRILVNGQRVEGRYGELQGAAAASNNNIPRPGFTGDTARVSDTYQVLANDMRLVATNHSQLQVPRDYLVDAFSPLASRNNWMVDGYGSAPDLDGDGVLVLDYRGNPYLPILPTPPSTPGRGLHGSGEPGEMFNDPYELDLSKSSNKWMLQGSGSYPALAPIDAPFTPAELERILRRYDADADYVNTSGSVTPMNDTRLTSLLKEAMASSPARFGSLFTTEGWDVPVAAPMVTIDNLSLKGAAAAVAQYKVKRVQNQSIQELLAARLLAATPAMTAQQVNQSLRFLLPPEVLAGRKMDLNRPFGNGRDDNGNGVVDEPAEAAMETVAGPDRAFINRPAKFAPLDANNDGVVPDALTQNSRLEYARHLYVLMMLIVDAEFYNNQGWNEPTPSAGSVRREVARRVAQWAVNVVDFRDRDAIMTGFEFDLYPFSDENGDGLPWDVNGDLTTDENNYTPPPTPPMREVVWGCERPELLITEAISTHERRTADESIDNLMTDNPNADNDYDQIARPRGTVAFELYNPGGFMDAPSPEVHEIVAPNDFGVNLAAVTNPGGNGSPVWRVVTHKANLYGQNGNPARLDDNNASRVAEHYRTVLPYTEIGKIAYFTRRGDANVVPDYTQLPSPASPTFSPSDIREFFRDGNAPQPDIVRPGRYALVAPAGRVNAQNQADNGAPYFRTYFGERQNPSVKRNDYPFYLQLAPAGQVGPYRNGNPEKPAAAKTIVGVPLAPSIVGNSMARFSVSEPNSGYSTLSPTGTNRSSIQFHTDDFFTSVEDAPIGHADLERNGYVQEGRSVLYLERLADPTRPWHKDANPYITIDRMPLELRSFRGEPVAPNTPPEGNAPAVDNDEKLDSFRRGIFHDQNSNDEHKRAAKRNVWSPWSSPFGVDNYGNANGDSELNRVDGTPANPLRNSTFGYLNGFTTPNAEYGPVFQANAADTQAAQATPSVPSSAYDGEMFVDPSRPGKPWLTWNNRPFVSPVELLLVPATTPPGLLLDHGIRANTFDQYNPPAATAELAAVQQPEFRDGFLHLLNFFVSASPSSGRQRGKAAELYRIFDYVEVPSRFTGTYDMLDPAEFSGPGLSTHYLHPPYNKLSRYREPGKINLNTIYDSAVWDALLDGAFGPAGGAGVKKWPEFVKSRRGYGNTPDLFDPSPAATPYPTLIANPFRPAGAYPFVPIDILMNFSAGSSGMRNQPINATLLREKPTGNGPLLAAPPTNAPHNDPERNPYFYYAGMQKIYNSVTTRSNVYAIWITVGFFEVTPNPSGIDAGHPDGWQLGAELGTDTGEIKRHRAFFLYDRTIPVGFQRGKTLNVEEGLLIRRYIE